VSLLWLLRHRSPARKKRPVARKHGRRARAKRALVLERLEDRTLLTAHVYQAAGLPLPIPAEAGGHLTVSSLVIEDSYLVNDIDLTLNITHPRTEELTISLRAPDGTDFPLVYGLGGANLTDTVLDDSASLGITQGLAPYTGRWRPTNWNGMAAFSSADVQGTWTLSVYDQVEGNSGTLDGWSLTIDDGAQPEQEANDTLETANGLNYLPGPDGRFSRWAPFEGTITPGDADYIRLDYPIPGLLTARVRAEGFAAHVSLLDASGITVAQSDDATGPDALAVGLVQNGPYYLKVEGCDGGTGAYTLTLATSSLNNGPGLGSDGTVTWEDLIEHRGDQRLFSFSAPVAGVLSVEMMTAEGFGLDGLLKVWGPDLRVLADNGDGGGSRVAVAVAEGETVYLNTAGADGTTGEYWLSLSLTQVESEANDTLETADFRPFYATPLAGTIDPGDVDYFRIQVPQQLDRSFVTVQLEAPAAAARLSLLDEAGNVVISQDAPAGGGEVVLTAPLRGGYDTWVSDDSGWWGGWDGWDGWGGYWTRHQAPNYYLRVEGGEGETGNYTLTTLLGPESFSPSVAEDGGATLPVTLAASADPVVISYYMPVSGSLNVSLVGTDVAPQRAEITVWNSEYQLLMTGQLASELGERLVVPLSSGSQINVIVRGLGTPPEEVILTLSPTQGEQEPNDSPDYATSLSAYYSGADQQYHSYPTTGTLTPEDVDQFGGSGPGVVTAKLQAPGVDARLTLRDEAGTILAQGDTLGAGEGGLALRAVVTGQVYFQVEGIDGGVGEYVLDTTLRVANGLGLSPAGPTTYWGNIAGPGQSEFWSVYVDRPGTLTVEMNPLEGSALDSLLTVWDGLSAQPLAVDDGDGAGSRVAISVTQPGLYVIETAGSTDTVGEYELQASFTAQEQETNDTPESANDLWWSPVAGTAGAGDRDVFRVYVSYGPAVLMARLVASGLNARLRFLDAGGNVLRQVEGTAAPGQDLVLQDLLAADTYYVEVEGRDVTPGEYTLSVSTQGELLYLDGTVPSAIGSPGQEKYFEKYVSGSGSSSGQLTLRLEGTDDSALLASMVLTDSSLRPLASAEGASPLEVRAVLPAEQRYYVRVAGVGGTVGNFTLTANFAGDDVADDFTTTRSIPLDYDEGAAVNYVSDVDMFRVDALYFGARRTFRLTARKDSPFLGAVAILDSAGTFVAGGDAAGSADGSAEVTFDPVPGETYYLRVAASPSATGERRTGAYVLHGSANSLEVEDNDSPATANSEWFFGRGVAGTLTPGDVDYFKVLPLTASISADIATRLTVLRSDGTVLATSDGVPGRQAEIRFSPFSNPTNSEYYLKVEGLGDATGAYLLTFSAAGNGSGGSPSPEPTPEQFHAVAAADFDGDGRLDLYTLYPESGEVGLRLGRGDGTFLPEARCLIGSFQAVVSVQDLNADGRADLVVKDTTLLSVLLGRGDGTFEPHWRTEVGGGLGWSAGALDLTGDGYLDLAITFGDEGLLLRGQGDGSFEAASALPAIAGYGLAADLDGDGLLDFLVPTGDGVVAYLNQGDGTFPESGRLTSWENYFGIGSSRRRAADFNGDGWADLIFTSEGGTFLALGRGDGTFALPRVVRASNWWDKGTFVPIPADYDRDGYMDVALVERTGLVYVLFGGGDGTFARQGWGYGDYSEQGFYFVNAIPGDFDGDGYLDLLMAPFPRSRLALVFGGPGGAIDLDRGQLWFGASARGHEYVPRAPSPDAFAQGDFDRDGRLDTVTADAARGTVAVALGQGDGTFQAGATYTLAPGAGVVTTADINGDGRLDGAVANFLDGTVTVLFGVGDGTFRAPASFGVGHSPVALVAADLDGDGRIDLATANLGSGDVSVLLNQGSGTFAPQRRFAAGAAPRDLAAADLDGDGRPDLAVADAPTGSVLVLWNEGGTFADAVTLAAGEEPVAVVAGDFTGDGRADLATANRLGKTLNIFPGQGGRSFGAPESVPLYEKPEGLLAGDVNGDGQPELVVTFFDRSSSPSVSPGTLYWTRVLRGPVAPEPWGRFESVSGAGLALADFNGDGALDLAALNIGGAGVSVFAGGGDGSFGSVAERFNLLRNQPVVADLDRDGRPDVLIVDERGRILFRHGETDGGNLFAAPVVVNPAPADAVRELAVVVTPGGWQVAALDRTGGLLSLYARGADGPFTRTAHLDVPPLSVRLLAGDLDGDGRDDLAVATALRTVSVFLQNPDGSFSTAYEADAGISPSDLARADLDGDGRADLVVTSHYSGDVSVLLGDAAASSPSVLRFRSDVGPYSLAALDGQLAVQSAASPLAVAAGDFDGDSRPDLLVLNADLNRVSLLRGDGAGGLLNPDPALSFETGSGPTALVTGPFDRDTFTDMAVLASGSNEVWVYAGSAGGQFVKTSVVPVGAGSTAMAVADVDGDSRVDLLIGNEYGDVLILRGQGNGTFRPSFPERQAVTLAVADLDGDGHDDFVLGQRSLDRVTVTYGATGRRVLPDQAEPLLAPAAVQLADLNGDRRQDLIVANSGGNSLLVYLGLEGGQFSTALSFGVGTGPGGLSLADLNGDGRLDVAVANKGSDDVSVLLGQGQGDSWTLVPGARLEVGSGPVATIVRDVNVDGQADLLVSNTGSNDVYLLPGLGNGFFNDTAAGRQVLAVGANPGQLFVGNFDRRAGLDLVTLNTGSNTLTLVSGFAAASASTFLLSSGGNGPIAGAADDFNADGLLDLVVANNSGGLAVLLGGDNGLTLTETSTPDSLLRLTDLALAGFGDGTVTVYLAAEDLEQALRWTLNLSPQEVAEAFNWGQAAEGFSPQQVTELVPLQETTTLTLAALVFLVAAPVAPPAVEASVSLPEPVFATLLEQDAPAVAEESAADSGSADDTDAAPAEDRAGEKAEEVAAEGGGEARTLVDAVLGLDEGFDQVRQRLRARWFGDGAAPADRGPVAAVVDALFADWPRLTQWLAEGCGSVAHAVPAALGPLLHVLQRALPGDRSSSEPVAEVSAPEEPSSSEPVRPWAGVDGRVPADLPELALLLGAGAVVSAVGEKRRRMRVGRRQPGLPRQSGRSTAQWT
jgi:subtilisin-like proprotein convertase family protein